MLAAVTVLLTVTSLFTLLLIILAIPINVGFQIAGSRRLRGQFSLHWLFGIVHFRIPVPGAENKRAKSGASQRQRKQPAIQGKRQTSAGFLAVVRQADFRERTYRFIKDLVRTVDLQRLQLLLKVGLGDPADTGRLWVLLGPIGAALQNIRNTDVRLEPEFMDAVLEVQADGQVRLIPLQILALAITFVLSPPSMRAWRILRRARA